MSCGGVHFALTQDHVDKLRALEDDSLRLDYITEEIEEFFFENDPERKAETDKAWDAIHRCLTDGRLEYGTGAFPLGHAVLGGEALYFKDDYIMSLKTPEQVKAVADALESLTEAELRQKYFFLDPEAYGFPLSEEDFEYTWYWLKLLIPFFRKAANEGRYVLFTVDQ
jgi:hypothetical protein